MEKKNYVFPRASLYFFIVVCVCFSIIVYLACNPASGGNAPILCAVMASLLGIASVSLTVQIMLYCLCKKNSGGEPEQQALADRRRENRDIGPLEPFLDGEIEAADKGNHPVSMIIADLDHFREINKTYGRIVGDHIITIFTQAVLKCIRPKDIITHYSGDELVIILPGADTETAKAVAEKIREEVSETYIPPVDGVLVSSIHCSTGVSTYPDPCDSKNALVRASDLALYIAKRSGRNCTRVYQNEPVES